MTLSLRQRMWLTLLPLLVLMAVLGGAGVVLLLRLGGSIGAILRENYDSVVYMERLKEDLERIDSSFTFALAGREKRPPAIPEALAVVRLLAGKGKEQHYPSILNQKNMEKSSKQARQTAEGSLIGFALGLFAAA